MRRLFRSLIVAVALLSVGGATAALAAPPTQKPADSPKDKAVELPTEAKASAKTTRDICDYVVEILTRTRFKDGTTQAQIKQYVVDQLSTMRLPDGVVIKPIDSCFPDTAKPGEAAEPKPDPAKDPGHTGGSANTSPPKHAPAKVDTIAPARSVAPNFTG